MTDKKLVRRWLSIFAQNVPKEIMDNHVTTDGNHMWHIFTWGNVPCLEGDAARAAFDQLQDIEVMQFYGGYDCKFKRVSIRKKEPQRHWTENATQISMLLQKIFHGHMCIPMNWILAPIFVYWERKQINYEIQIAAVLLQRMVHSFEHGFTNLLWDHLYEYYRSCQRICI